MSIRSKQNGFTIVELLIVIVVIGILAALVLNSFSQAQAKARDTARVNDLKAIQKAVELYRAENGSYPLPTRGNNLWSGNCASYGSVTTYVSDVTEYLPQQPIDPRWKDAASDKCYLYRSDGNDYIAIAWNSMESICGGDPSNSCNPANIQALDRPAYTQPTIAVYSPGARLW